MLYMIFDGAVLSVLSRADGIMLMGFFAIFLYYTFGIERVSGEEAEQFTRIESDYFDSMVNLYEAQLSESDHEFNETLKEFTKIEEFYEQTYNDYVKKLQEYFDEIDLDINAEEEDGL